MRAAFGPDGLWRASVRAAAHRISTRTADREDARSRAAARGHGRPRHRRPRDLGELVSPSTRVGGAEAPGRARATEQPRGGPSGRPGSRSARRRLHTPLRDVGALPRAVRASRTRPSRRVLPSQSDGDYLGAPRPAPCVGGHPRARAARAAGPTGSVTRGPGVRALDRLSADRGGKGRRLTRPRGRARHLSGLKIASRTEAGTCRITSGDVDRNVTNMPSSVRDISPARRAPTSTTSGMTRASTTSPSSRRSPPATARDGSSSAPTIRSGTRITWPSIADARLSATTSKPSPVNAAALLGGLEAATCSRIEHDLVVGGGPAGMTAAIALRAQGLQRSSSRSTRTGRRSASGCSCRDRPSVRSARSASSTRGSRPASRFTTSP